MKSFTWVTSLAKKLKKIISLVFFICAEMTYADFQVANIMKYDCDNLKIRDLSQANAEIGRFEIEIIKDTIRFTNDGLEFDVKITPTVDEIIKYKNEEIKLTEKGRIFSVCIENDKLSNRPFYEILKFSSENHDLRFDDAKLLIEPVIELKIEGKPVVHFGKILWKEGHLKSDKSPEVHFSYQILKDTICKVESKNGFKLKHDDKEEFMEYSLSIHNVDIKNSETNPKEKEFDLVALQNNFIAKFKIDSHITRVPSEGNWGDTATFEIVCEK